MISGQGKEVLVALPNDDSFLTEMRAYLKIERFLRKNTSCSLQSMRPSRKQSEWRCGSATATPSST